MKIIRYPTINYTPALVLAMRGWVEMVNAGIGECCASIHWEQKGILAVDDSDVPIGVMTWSHQPSLTAIYIEQAYVVPEWRRRGVCRAMLRDLVEQSERFDVICIRLGTHNKNVDACAAWRTLGMNPTAVFFEMELAGQPVAKP